MSISSRDSIKTSGLLDLLHRAVLQLTEWTAKKKIKRASNSELEDAYNYLRTMLAKSENVVLNKKVILDAVAEGKAKIEQDGIESVMTQEQANEIIKEAEGLIAATKNFSTEMDEEIKKRNLKINQLPNGKYYFMEQKVAKMKLNHYASRSLQRFIRMNKSSAAEPIDVLEKALALSEAEREEYIKNFVKEHGLKEVFNLVKKAVSEVLNSKQPVTAQLYEGFRKKKVVTDEERNAKPTHKEMTHPTDSRLRTALEKLGDWSVLLTFFLMYAAISTSDYHNLVTKQPDISSEIKVFLLASGSAFMAWVFRYLRSLLK